MEPCRRLYKSFCRLRSLLRGNYGAPFMRDGAKKYKKFAIALHKNTLHGCIAVTSGYIIGLYLSARECLLGCLVVARRTVENFGTISRHKKNSRNAHAEYGRDVYK
jgi:hypothetical protein